MSDEGIPALVVDDEAPSRRTIRMLAERDPAVRVVAECRTGHEALAALRRSPIDLLFLDIQMPGLDGFATLAGAGAARAPAVIIVSGFAEHAVRAFDVQAVDYLLKPFGDERFRSALERAKAHLRVRRMARQVADALGPSPPAVPAPALERLVVKEAGRVRAIAVDEIVWIDAQDYYAEIHAPGRTHLVRMSLHRLEERLDPRRFVRIHRSTIVNVRQVKELEPLFHGEYLVRLLDGTRLKLSRTYRNGLERLLGS